MVRQASSPPTTSKTGKRGGREKKRGVSPFSMRMRGTSPFRRNNNNNSAKSRGLSPFRRKNKGKGLGRKQSSGSSLGSPSSSHDHQGSSKDLVVCHGSARSIVFRDHLRLAAKIIKEETDQELFSDDEISLDDSSDDGSDGSLLGVQDMKKRDEMEDFRNSIRQSIRLSNISNGDDNAPISQEINNLARNMVPELGDVTLRVPYASERNVEIEGQQVHMKPLPQLELGPQQDFEALLQYLSSSDNDNTDWTTAEQEVYTLLMNQQACVKTIKNSEWPSFLKRFQDGVKKEKTRFPTQHDDIAPSNDGLPFNSFVTSTTLLPELGKKMRCYGSLHAYPVGVVFALPDYSSSQEKEKEATTSTKTWAWPPGYAAKTEFNIERGQLINGREEGLVSLHQMRAYNHDYVYKQDHVIGGRLIKGGFNVVPYNEVFLRVGGRTRIVNKQDCVTGEERDDAKGTGRSFATGMGLPVALFIRSTTIGDILTLFRTRARMAHVLGEQHIRGMPMIVISNKYGVRVFSESLQHEFWKLAAHKLNPFQNPLLEHVLMVDDPKMTYLQQKAQEQLLFDDHIQNYLSLEECARIAGGFGSTDEFLASILERAREKDAGRSSKHHEALQKVMTAGLDAALRSNDYYTARQMLVVYAIVASGHFHDRFDHRHEAGHDADKEASSSLEFSYCVTKKPPLPPTTSLAADGKSNYGGSTELPPIDTWRLRNATNSQGILFVLGAAEILTAVKDGGAQRRTQESIAAVEEWVEYGEQSVAFRVASWSKQRATEFDTNIALEGNSQFMAFISKKAISNRKGFAKKLQQSLEGYTDLSYVKGIYDIVQSMHSPCLRLEILQYILGLDNRFSVDHIRHAMELAITCMVIGSS